MIHSITSDRPGFKTVNFGPGFNIVVADRTHGSRTGDSGNGLGKSTIIDILHFCLGGRKSGTLSKKQMNGFTFTTVLDVNGKRLAVSRRTDRASTVFLEGPDDFGKWPAVPGSDGARRFLRTADWNKTLGVFMYGLEPEPNKYGPAFRSLISYFARRDGQAGGYLDPFQQNSRQKNWDIQASGTFLLGLGWRFASRWKQLRDEKKILGELKKESMGGLVSDLIGKRGDLEAARIRLAGQIDAEAEAVKAFRVHPQYRRLEDEIDRITQKMHELEDLNMTDRSLLRSYRKNVETNPDTDPEAATILYVEAGFVFPRMVAKQLCDLQDFHGKLIRNRRDFLESEMERLVRDTGARDLEIERLDLKRSEMMAALKTHGALDEFGRIQENHQRLVGELEDVKNRLKSLERLEDARGHIKAKLETLYLEAGADLADREVQRRRAARAFNSYAKRLYGGPGALYINVNKSGYRLDASIWRSESRETENIKIFCYDMTLAELWLSGRTSPGFLVHDSVLYDGLDEMQVAAALRIAADESQEKGFQYICMMNSDRMPRAGLGELERHISARLTDERPDGGLLGERF